VRSPRPVLGRLPEANEFPLAAEVEAQFGSVKRALALVKRATGTDAWDAIAGRRTEDLSVYLALGRFRRRPRYPLPLGLQRDRRAFFGSYATACRLAGDRLFRAGDAEAVDDACRHSAVGKLLPNALYVHRSALESLDPLLRIYEGCARAYLGEIDGANLIKLHRHSGKVSYLVYPDFETDPHPALLRSIKLSLRTREIDCLEFAASAHPPDPAPARRPSSCPTTSRGFERLTARRNEPLLDDRRRSARDLGVGPPS
jgi:DNA phosphorothioation-associated putative methyltransferase